MPFKALLVTSPARHKNNFWTCSITSPVGSLMPPCDLASIAAVLRNAGIVPKILDIRLDRDPIGSLKREVTAWRPDAVITNMGTASAMEDYEILKATCSTVEKRICFCFHAMALPDEMFDRGATHILVGDPEYAAVAAVKGEAVEKGLWTREDTTAEPGWIESLDELPYPAIDLLNPKAYHSLIMGNESFSILLATRGCPYSCTYCVIPFFLGRKIRTCSVERIVGEIERDYVKYAIRSFFFIDSAINLNPQWAMAFCEEVLRRKLNIRWCANMRVSPVYPALLRMMKRAGCFRVFFGVEDLDLIDELNRKTSREATLNAFSRTRAAGIETVAFVILVPGFDPSERAMAGRIIRMVQTLNADALQCNIAIPYPGSRMFETYNQKYTMPRDWSLYDPAGAGTPYPTGLDLVKARRMVYLRYFMRNPRYVWKTVKQAGWRSIFAFLRNASQVLWHHQGRSTSIRPGSMDASNEDTDE